MSRLINIFLTVGLAGFPLMSSAQMATTDAATQALIQTQTLSELAKWADSLAKMDEQIQHATQQVSKLNDIGRFIGNPAGTQLPGSSLGAIGSIYKHTTSIYRSANDVSTFATGLAGGGTSQLGGMYSVNDAFWMLENAGEQFDQGRYKRYQATATAADKADAMNSETMKEMDQLNDELTSLQERLNSATTQAEIEKLNGLISAVQSKIAALEVRRKATMDTQALLHYQNQNDAAERKDKAAEAVGTALGDAGQALKPSGNSRSMSAIPGR